MLTAKCYRCLFCRYFAQERGEKKDYNSLQYLRQCYFLKVSLVINTSFRPDCVHMCGICFFLTLCYTQLTNTCPHLRYNPVHLQHTLIQDVGLMFLDMNSPLGAVIGSTTWHKNIAFPLHPFLGCRQLTPVSGFTKDGTFIFSVSIHPLH